MGINVIDPAVITFLAAGWGSVVCLLAWVLMQVVRLTNRMSVIETHIGYLRREVAYVNGRAEPEDEQ